MPTECSRDLFGYEVVEGRQVVAAFDGGDGTTDAGALLLGATDRAIGLVRRLAGCFIDGRAPELVEHTVETMLMQRICGIALAGPGTLELHEVIALRRAEQKGVPAELLPAATARHGREVDAADPDLQQAGLVPEALVLARRGRSPARWRPPSGTASPRPPRPSSAVPCLPLREIQSTGSRSLLGQHSNRS